MSENLVTLFISIVTQSLWQFPRLKRKKVCEIQRFDVCQQEIPNCPLASIVPCSLIWLNSSSLLFIRFPPLFSSATILLSTSSNVKLGDFCRFFYNHSQTISFSYQDRASGSCNIVNFTNAGPIFAFDLTFQIL